MCVKCAYCVTADLLHTVTDIYTHKHGAYTKKRKRNLMQFFFYHFTNMEGQSCPVMLVKPVLFSLHLLLLFSLGFHSAEKNLKQTFTLFLPSSCLSGLFPLTGLL